MLKRVVHCLRKLCLLCLMFRDGNIFGQLNVYRPSRTKYLVLKNTFILEMLPVYCMALVRRSFKRIGS